jgi:hypothetical protein
MSNNPCIAAVARILGSNEPFGALATILFNHYTALPSTEERNAFASALIGELLVAKSRVSLLATSEVSEGGGAPEIEITPEMIEAGFAKLYEFDITHPMEGEMREAVRDVFLSMLRARPKSRSS